MTTNIETSELLVGALRAAYRRARELGEAELASKIAELGHQARRIADVQGDGRSARAAAGARGRSMRINTTCTCGQECHCGHPVPCPDHALGECPIHGAGRLRPPVLFEEDAS